MEGGLRLVVRVTPRGGRDAIDGLRTDGDGRPMLGVRVSAPPAEGEANAALIRLLAKQLGLRQSDVTVATGATGRVKQLHLAGEPETLSRALESLMKGTKA